MRVRETTSLFVIFFFRAACYFSMQRLLFQFCNHKPINPAARVEINHFHIMVSYYYFHDSMSLSPGATHLLQQCKWKTGLYDKETSRRSMFHCVTTLFKYFWTLCCKWPEEHSCCFSFVASYDTGISSKASGINKSLWGKMTRGLLTGSPYPGTPSWGHLTSVHGRGSLWTLSAFLWPLLGRLQEWVELLWGKTTITKKKMQTRG